MENGKRNETANLSSDYITNIGQKFREYILHIYIYMHTYIYITTTAHHYD